MQNGVGTRQQKWHVIDTRCSADVPAGSADVLHAKENPDALAGAIGAETIVEIGCSDSSQELPGYATAFVNAVAGLPRKERLPLLEVAADHYRAGQPIPPLFAVMAEARDWASWASRAELKAYALACFERLNDADRAAFLLHVAGSAAA